MYEINLRELIPKAVRDAKVLLAGLPAEVFLGENPLSATLLVPGTADRTKDRFSTMEYKKDRKAVRRAEKLYDAWLSFYRGEIEKAQVSALTVFEDIGKGEAKIPASGETKEQPAYLQKLGASYLLCCLARYGTPGHHTDAAVSYMKELRDSGLRSAQAAEINLAMYEMSIGIMSGIPSWIREGEFGVGRVGDRLLFSDDGVYPENIYAAVIAAVQYRNYHGAYMKSLALIDTAQKVYGMQSVIIGDVYFALYRALNCEALGYPDEVETHLKHAVRLVQKDKLWQIISQFSDSFGETLPQILKKTDREGYARCEELSDGFIERIKQSHSKEQELRGFQEMTPQEYAVTRLWAAGRKNTEIAKELFISTGTVKFHKRNASNKLGIGTKANVAEIREALARYESRAEWIS